MEKQQCLQEVLTITEASKMWGKEVSTLRHRMRDGRFPEYGYRKSGATVLVTRSAMTEVYGPLQVENDEEE